jgi:uncharacterized protein YdeI (YjbR/CyaY-like superfamily)
MIATERFAKVEIDSLDALRVWLEANHAMEDSVWLVRWKKSKPERFVDRLDVLDALICYGWVDGMARKLDATRTMQLVSPRRQQAWAQSYKDRADRLERDGLMRPAGRAAIARSRALGLWDTFAPVDALKTPDDLRAALACAPPASAFFDAAAPSYRRNALRWIFLARRPETRARRIAALVERSSRGEKLPQM